MKFLEKIKNKFLKQPILLISNVSEPYSFPFYGEIWIDKHELLRCYKNMPCNVMDRKRAEQHLKMSKDLINRHKKYVEYLSHDIETIEKYLAV